jgi:FtsP/CotA-like multicopper oxidase with cupredoxin domain
MTRFEPNTFGAGIARSLTKLAAIAVLLVSVSAHASIDGDVVTGSVDLTAGEGYILVADGASIYSWGYSKGTEAMQLPGPTLIVTAGETFNVTLSNNLPAAAGNVSIVFPGLIVNSVSGGVQGDLAQEATSGSTVTYNVTAPEPGTYQYHSGTQPDLQVEMGLYGALIVRPAAAVAECAGNAGAAYDHGGTCFDQEYLFLLSQMDIDIHQAAELQAGGDYPIVLPTGAYHSEYWLMNGRAAPDTLAPPGRALLPHQPYNIIPRMHPGEKLLLRLVGAGREQHPFHTHGNHVRILARDGRLIVSESDPTALAGPTLFTIPSLPGGTVDAVFEWTGKDLGWDIYGHTSDDPATLEDNEWVPDHGKPIPVDLPSLSSLAFGGFYSGSPFLGAMGALPPGEGGLNPNAGFTYMWHSHAERELVNNDVFPGGMLTMLIIEPHHVVID